MSDEIIDEKIDLIKKKKTKVDKQAEHIGRIKRTLTASLIGIFAGGLSFYISKTYSTNTGHLAFMIMAAGIVIQKHIFMLLHMDTAKLGAKDWFYQSFMTFAFWIISWTILLTAVSQ